MDLFDILKQDKEEEATTATTTSHEENEGNEELVSLSLGISSKGQPILMDEKKNSNRTVTDDKREEDDENLNEGLALGLDIIRFDPSISSQVEAANNNPSLQSSFDDDEEGKELDDPNHVIWSPSKVLKTRRNGDKSEASHQHTQLKKARVSIRARCDTQMMNDGCQWRKYGQKIAKRNPCPRAYYRCNVSLSCPARKQVQRCAEDMSILITTYEGTHNHPLPTSATTMASTTSAAASMLQSPSLFTSQLQLGQPNNSSNTLVPIILSNYFNVANYNLNNNALNFCTSQISRRPLQQFYFPCNPSISTSNSQPTITLDLTLPPPITNSSHFGIIAPPSFSNSIPKCSSTSLNFSSSFSPWSTSSGYFNCGTLTQNRNQSGSLINTGKQPYHQGHLYQPHYNYMTNHKNISQQPLPDSIANATKTITTNPKFQSALAAALTTYIAKYNEVAGGRVKENFVGVEHADLNLKLAGGMYYTKNIVYKGDQA